MTDKKATETLVADSSSVVVGDETYVVKVFCLAKTIRTFTLLSELAAAVGISEVIGAANDSAEAGEFAQAIAPGFVTKIVAMLPRALAQGTPALFRLLGLVVTPNARLREWEEGEVDTDAELLRVGRRLAYEGTNDQVVNLLMTGVAAIGVETILNTVPKLMTLLGNRS